MLSWNVFPLFQGELGLMGLPGLEGLPGAKVSAFEWIVSLDALSPCLSVPDYTQLSTAQPAVPLCTFTIWHDIAVLACMSMCVWQKRDGGWCTDIHNWFKHCYYSNFTAVLSQSTREFKIKTMNTRILGRVEIIGFIKSSPQNGPDPPPTARIRHWCMESLFCLSARAASSFKQHQTRPLFPERTCQDVVAAFRVLADSTTATRLPDLKLFICMLCPKT